MLSPVNTYLNTWRSVLQCVSQCFHTGQQTNLVIMVSLTFLCSISWLDEENTKTQRLYHWSFLFFISQQHRDYNHLWVVRKDCGDHQRKHRAVKNEGL